MDLNLQIKPRGEDRLIASYSCPCGCQPRVTYAKGTPEVTDGCCCGNEFAVGPGAGGHLHAADGFTLQVDRFKAPWGEPLEAAWTLGQTQAPAKGNGHDHGHEHEEHHHRDPDEATATAHATTAVDPVCGMTVDIASAVEKGLRLNHEGTDYYFCGKGCKLEFGDDPARFLDPSYVPSM